MFYKKTNKILLNNIGQGQWVSFVRLWGGGYAAPTLAGEPAPSEPSEARPARRPPYTHTQRQKTESRTTSPYTHRDTAQRARLHYNTKTNTKNEYKHLAIESNRDQTLLESGPSLNPIPPSVRVLSWDDVCFSHIKAISPCHSRLKTIA